MLDLVMCSNHKPWQKKTRKERNFKEENSKTKNKHTKNHTPDNNNIKIIHTGTIQRLNHKSHHTSTPLNTKRSPQSHHISTPILCLNHKSHHTCTPWYTTRSPQSHDTSTPWHTMTKPQITSHHHITPAHPGILRGALSKAAWYLHVGLGILLGHVSRLLCVVVIDFLVFQSVC